MEKIYSALTKIAYPIAYPYLKKRYKIGFDERRGIYAQEKIEKIKGAFWVHAVSVGEVQAASAFISELKKTEPSPILLSTTTITGEGMAHKLNIPFDEHIYYPWDTKKIVSRALDAIAPRAYVAVETEMWPLMLFELKKRGVPTFLINGRISDKSFAKMKKMNAKIKILRNFWRDSFDCFDILMMRDDVSAERLINLGISPAKITITGDCKIDVLIERAKKTSLFAERNEKIFLAGSTHRGEDEQVLDAYAIVKKNLSHTRVAATRLIIVPRHPHRAEEVAQLARSKGMKTKFFSEIEGDEMLFSDVLVVDKIGVLFGLYAQADAVFIGGSLVPKGGQNLMESAIFGVPTCHGQDMSDFRAVADEFDALGISQVVRNAQEIADFWLNADAIRDKTKAAAQSWFASHGGASKKCCEEIIKTSLLRCG